MPLTAGQRRYLRGVAHPRKVTVWMGRQGAAAALLREVDAALDAHELIKIRLAAADRKERDRILRGICASTRSELVQRVGNIGTLYRERREDPGIRLPADQADGTAPARLLQSPALRRRRGAGGRNED